MPERSERSNPVTDEAAQCEEARALMLMLACVFLGMAFMTWWGRRDAGGVELERIPQNIHQYRIDLNLANEMELQHLPGIGPALASRIVADRDVGGEFHSLADLVRRVRGVGPSLVERIKPYTSFSEEPLDSAPLSAVKSSKRRGKKPPIAAKDIDP